jgi:molybdopterin biosynthesis enzyme
VPQDVVEEAAAPVAEQTEAVIQAATQPVTETEEVATTEAPAEAAAADDATETTKPSETEATADTSASADEYKPLSEVEDDIRRAIAAPRAQGGSGADEQVLQTIRDVRSSKTKRRNARTTHDAYLRRHQ